MISINRKSINIEPGDANTSSGDYNTEASPGVYRLRPTLP